MEQGSSGPLEHLSHVCPEYQLVSGVRGLALFKVCCSFPKVLVPVPEGLHDFLNGEKFKMNDCVHCRTSEKMTKKWLSNAS